MKKNILFVCMENSNRSQMAEAFSKIHGEKTVNAYSAGSKPSGVINPKAIAAMKESRYDLSIHKSKSLNEIPNVVYEYAITMGCGDECPFVIAHHKEDWDIPDPKNMEPDSFRSIRDLIEQKVKDLLKGIRSSKPGLKLGV
ncbi:MAG: arsenate reductase ArsC [Chitinophagales bacterium]